MLACGVLLSLSLFQLQNWSASHRLFSHHFITLPTLKHTNTRTHTHTHTHTHRFTSISACSLRHQVSNWLVRCLNTECKCPNCWHHEHKYGKIRWFSSFLIVGILVRCNLQIFIESWFFQGFIYMEVLMIQAPQPKNWTPGSCLVRLIRAN